MSQRQKRGKHGHGGRIHMHSMMIMEGNGRGRANRGQTVRRRGWALHHPRCDKGELHPLFPLPRRRTFTFERRHAVLKQNKYSSGFLFFLFFVFLKHFLFLDRHLPHVSKQNPARTHARTTALSLSHQLPHQNPHQVPNWLSKSTRKQRDSCTYI